MNIALVLSGGTGTRVGTDIPKQYIEVGGKPVISYCIETLSAHERIDAIWVTAAENWHEPIRDWMETSDIYKKFRGFSLPGENRQLSILNGLEDIRSLESCTETAGGEVEETKKPTRVLICDAVRPLLSEKQITECFFSISGHDGVLPVLPMKDTVYSSTDGERISGLLNRKEIYAGQAPELFQLDKYYEANKRLTVEKLLKINGSTEPAILAGMDIVMIPGDEDNFKITTPADLERFKELERRKK